MKAKSDARKSKWPNTLEALRKKKENWRTEREAEAEAARREVDKQEEEHQKKSRMDSIRNANNLLYEQTDKMKNLRSQQLYSEVIQDRKRQVEERLSRRQAEQEKEDVYVLVMAKQLADADARELQEDAKRKQKSQEIATIQQAQLAEFKENYISRLKEDMEDGILIAKKAQDDIEEERLRQVERSRAARVAAEEMRLANERLKVLRAEIAKEEELEEQKRKVDIEKKERLAKARAELEGKRFAEKQRIRQRMIDRACEHLAEVAAAADSREVKQAEEARAKEDAEMERRNERRRKQQEAIDKSRMLQVQMRKERAEQERQQNAILAEHWKQRNTEVEREEREEREAKVRRAREVRRSQESQIADKRRKRMEARAAQLLADEQTAAVMAEDDERFRGYADRVISEFEAAGKPTYTLQCARGAKDITVLPAGGSRI